MILSYEMTEEIEIPLKQLLKNNLFLSNRMLTILKQNQAILVNRVIQNVSYLVKKGDRITVTLPIEEKKFSDKFCTIKKDFEILYEDDFFLVVNKKAGIPVHPSCDHYENTLANYVAYYLEEKGINGIHIVTRLDKNTSGICIFAKNRYIQELLIRKKNQIQLQKEYICLVKGIVKKDHDIIELPIARKQDTIILREVNPNGDFAKTEYFIQKRNRQNNYSILKVLLHTGRTHQIRVHFSHLGHPLLGDDLYANEKDKANIKQFITRQALHCKKIQFFHPITNDLILLEASIPKDMSILIER